jgi:hypothetical protein
MAHGTWTRTSASFSQKYPHLLTSARSHAVVLQLEVKSDGGDECLAHRYLDSTVINKKIWMHPWPQISPGRPLLGNVELAWSRCPHVFQPNFFVPAETAPTPNSRRRATQDV